MERFSQTLHECGPGTPEIKGVMFDAEISSDIKEYCQNVESSNIGNYTSSTIAILLTILYNVNFILLHLIQSFPFCSIRNKI